MKKFSILENFLKEIEERNNGSEIEKLHQRLLEEEFHPSISLKNRLQKHLRRAKYPLKIAVVGQFSSGKSTFLNALMSKNILPTGITPVTSKINYINYAKEYKLKITFKSGVEEFAPLQSIADFTDQRKNEIENIKYLSIYAPIEMLKDISFVDSPGLNSLSENDTIMTKNVLKDVGGIIWLTLIDNAGKESEKSILQEYVNQFKNKSLCVLNQKDRFNIDEIETTKNYMEKNFHEYFKKVVPISSKMALESTKDKKLYAKSNIQEVFNFIEKDIRPQAEKMKEYKLKKGIVEICDILISEYDDIILVHKELINLLQTKEQKALLAFDSLQKNFNNEIYGIFETIESILDKISNEIYQNTHLIKKEKMNVSSKWFNRKIVTLEAYEISSIDSDTIYKNLFYNDDILLNLFKSVERDLNLLEKQIIIQLDSVYKNMSDDIKLWQVNYEIKRKNYEIASDFEFSLLRQFVAKVYENILSHYHLMFLASQNYLGKKFSYFKGAFSYSYVEITKATVAYFKRRIRDSEELFLNDETSFNLYTINLEEINKKLKSNMKFDNIEEFLTGRQNFLVKNTKVLKKQYIENNLDRIRFVQDKIDTYIFKIDKLKKIKKDIDFSS